MPRTWAIRSTAVWDERHSLAEQTVTKDNITMPDMPKGVGKVFFSFLFFFLRVEILTQVILLPQPPFGQEVCVMMSSFFFYFLSALLSCDLHTIKSSLWFFFCILTELCDHHCVNLIIFPSSPHELHSHLQSLSFLSQPQRTTNLLVSLDFPLTGISHERSHILCGPVNMVSFT